MFRGEEGEERSGPTGRKMMSSNPEEIEMVRKWHLSNECCAQEDKSIFQNSRRVGKKREDF